MAREIPRMDRQVIESPQSLPHYSGAARLSEMLGGLSNAIGQKAVSLNVEQAAIKGAQERFEGKSKKLAPGITAATQSYNKAFLAMDNQINLASIDKEMNQTFMDLTKAGSFNYDSPALFSQYAKKQIQGVMQNIPEQNRPEFALHASKLAANLELKMQYLAHQKSQADIKAKGEITLNQLLEDYTNALRTEQSGVAQDIKEQYLATLGDLKQIIAMDPKEEHLFKESLKQADISARFYKRGQNDAIASPGTAEKQLYEFAVNPPSDLSPTDQDIALKAYAEGVSHVDKFKNEQNTINTLQIHNDINQGKIKTTAQLELRANEIDAASYIRLDDQLYNKNAAEIGGQESVNNFIKRAQIGGGLQNIKTPDKVKEAAFVQLKDAYLFKKREDSEDPYAELSPQDEANVLMQLNSNIPSVDARINYAISKGDAQLEMGNIAWALGMVRGVGSDKPNTINLSDKNRAIAIMANSSLQWGGETNVGRAITAARATVNAKETEYAGRAAAFRAKTRNEINDAFKKVFPDANPAMDKTAFGAFVQNYETQYLMTDSDDDALEATRQKMQSTFGTSKYFRPGQVGYLPLEKVIPGTELGGRVWLTNQLRLLALKVAENHKNASIDELDPANKVEWVGQGIPDPEVKKLGLNNQYVPRGPLQQEELFLYGGTKLGVSELRSPTGIMYRIKGQDRVVYVQADSMSRVGDGTGVNVRFYTINPDTNLPEYVVDPKSSSGFAYVKVQGLEQFLPDVYKSLTEDNIESWANKVVIEEYKEKNKIPILRQFGFANFVRNRKPEVIKGLKEFGKTKGDKQNKTKPIDVYEALDEYQGAQADGSL